MVGIYATIILYVGLKSLSTNPLPASIPPDVIGLSSGTTYYIQLLYRNK